MSNGDTPQSLPPDFFDKRKPPDSLPPDFFSKKTAEMPPPDAIARARAEIARNVPKEDEPFLPAPLGYTDPAAQRAFAKSLPTQVRVGSEMTGAVVGGALIPGAPAAAEGSGFLKWFLPMLARASGVGFGAGFGGLVTGEKPKEALATASQFTSMEAAGEAGTKVASKGVKLLKDVTKSRVKLMEEAHAAEAAKAEEAFQKKVTEHKEAKQQVMTEYKEDLQKHAAATKEASATESAAKAKTGIAVKHQNDLAGLVKQNLELTDEKISTALGKEFDTVQQAVEAKNPEVDIAPVVKAAEKAKSGLLLADSQAAFDRVMASIQPAETPEAEVAYRARPVGQKGVPAGDRPVATSSLEKAKTYKQNLESMTGKPHEVVGIPLDKIQSIKHVGPDESMWHSFATEVPEESLARIGSIEYGQIRRAYTKLNDFLYGGGEIPSDLYKAVKQVRDALGDVSQSAADSVGLGGKHSRVMRDWSEYKDVFHDKSAIAKGGSPIRRILDAEDPAFVVDQLKGKAGDRLIEDIGKYSKYGADKGLAGRLKGFIEKVRAMPSTAGGLPEAPKRPALPKAPEREASAPFDREATARKILVDRIKSTAKAAGIAGGGALLYHLLFGGAEPPKHGGIVP